MLAVKEALRPWYLRNIYFKLASANRPSQFSHCWDYPELEAGSVNLENTVGPNWLFLPMNDWHVRTQRTQFLATEFARAGHFCCYANPNFGRQFPHCVGQRPTYEVRQLQRRVWELHLGLPREPVFHHRLLAPEEDVMLADGIEVLAGGNLRHGTAQLVSFPVWFGCAEILRDRHSWPIVYDCHDLLEGFGNIARSLVDAEKRLLQRADAILFSSQFLLDYHVMADPSLRAKSTVVRNGVDSSLASPEISAARERTGRTRTTVGYIGAIEWWFDVEAVSHAALENPNFDFVLVGNVDSKAAQTLGRLPNVKLIGEQPHSGLAVWLDSFDIGIIPFQLTPLTRAADPIKFYEYLSCGIPVIASELPELASAGEFVSTYRTPGQFSALLRTAVREDLPELRIRRKEFARSRTWTARAEEINSFLKKCLFQRAAAAGAHSSKLL